MTRWSRRRVLRLTGVGLAASLAGCSTQQGEGEENPGGGIGEGGEEGGEGGEGGGEGEEGRIVDASQAAAGTKADGTGDGGNSRDDGEGCFDGGWSVVPRE